MKYSTVLSLAMAPLAMAKVIRNVYPVEKRNGHLTNGGGAVVGGANGVVVGGTNGVVVGGTNAVVVGGGTQVIIVWVNPGNNAATTTVREAVTVTQTVTAGVADTTVGTATVPAGATTTVAGPGATHTVQVGGAAGLAYSPPEIKAAVGDMVVFTFMSQNHTVTQSTFAAPCDPMEGGMNSGFQPNKDNAVVPAPQVAMQVMTAEPIWFYCAQMGHCGKGMVFSINPSTDKTQAMFQAMAIQQKGQGAGSAITGNATSSAVAGDPAATGAPAATEAPAGTDAPAATETPAAGAGGATGTGAAEGAIQTGTGELVAGACVCAVTCTGGAFPAANVQGIGNFGGIPGAIPASMAEVF
ncbi:putative serine-threonine rich protein [Rosellinia necatrix]|uniref:Putative serine-threonine rich protein n=1 Tax=Rosellinia necatrix TaxID=77044 RepID=A0A1S7UKK2_ROSNE|nr:putative serine-threonine rich protein [Rosellinia necatrix]